jgi:hypothetical protein
MQVYEIEKMHGTEESKVVSHPTRRATSYARRWASDFDKQVYKIKERNNKQNRDIKQR